MATATRAAQKVELASVTALLQEALARFHAGDLRGAQSLCQQVLELAPAHPDALQMLALIAYQSGNAELALRLFDFLIRTAPGYDAYFNRAMVHTSLAHPEQALEDLNQAVALNPHNIDGLMHRATALQEMERQDAALQCYDTILALQPDFADAWNNRGSALRKLSRPDEALLSFQRAVALKSDYADAHYNLGNLLLELKDYPAAVAAYDRALRLNPESFGAWNNRGTAFQCMQDHAHAAVSFERALRLQPDFPYLLGTCIHMKRHVCDWTRAESDLRVVQNQLREGKKVINPFALMAVSDSPALQKRAAEIYVEDLCGPVAAKAIPPRPKGEKIRVGYFSSDFRNHAVSYHMAEVFERHDRSRFETYAFSSGPDTQDAMRARVCRAMDHFLDVRDMSDSDVVRLSRELEIDIAVNLTGLTYGDRIRIFAERAAPVQVNYLGFPATMGAAFMDYIVADPVLVPESSQEHYAEKIAYLPDSFQANDSMQIVPALTTTRGAEGLPDHGFIFCCFNNCGKITPEVFSLWMRILSRVKGSVLWLLANTPEAQANLRREASQRGISPERIVFAQSVPLEQHLSRQQLADLFLDTHPFNAGATASPALRAGLPILTRLGESFAGRMGASLLQAFGLPDLIMATPEAYVDRAVAIAASDAYRCALKERIRQNRPTTSLFNTQEFTRNLEAAYGKMYEIYHAGDPPRHIQLEETASSTISSTTQHSSIDPKE